MKNILLATLFTAALSSQANATMGSQTNVKFVGDTEFASFCQAVLDDNVALFKRSLRRQLGTLGSTQQNVLARILNSDNVQCAGQGIVEFSQQRDASKVFKFISKGKA